MTGNACNLALRCRFSSRSLDQIEVSGLFFPSNSTRNLFSFFHSEWFLFIDFTKVTIKYELVILNWQDVNIWACWPLCGLVTGWWPVRGAPCLSPCDSCDRLRPVSDPESDAQKKMDGCMQNVVFECQPFPLDTNIFFTHCRCFCATGVVLFSASVCSFEPVSGT